MLSRMLFLSMVDQISGEEFVEHCDTIIDVWAAVRLRMFACVFNHDCNGSGHRVPGIDVHVMLSFYKVHMCVNYLDSNTF